MKPQADGLHSAMLERTGNLYGQYPAHPELLPFHHRQPVLFYEEYCYYAACGVGNRFTLMGVLEIFCFNRWFIKKASLKRSCISRFIYLLIILFFLVSYLHRHSTPTWYGHCS
jgi:hypothetical protein